MNGGGTCDGWAGSQNIKTIHVMAIMPFIKANSNKFLPYNLIKSLGTCTIAIWQLKMHETKLAAFNNTRSRIFSGLDITRQKSKLLHQFWIYYVDINYVPNFWQSNYRQPIYVIHHRVIDSWWRLIGMIRLKFLVNLYDYEKFRTELIPAY